MSIKKECDKCGKKYRARTLVVYKPTGELRCFHCIRKYGQNRFYQPKGENKGYNNMEIKPDERQGLFVQLTTNGMSPEQANKRINNRQRYLRWFQRHQYWKNKNKITQEQIQERNKQYEFLKGLGQVKG